MKCDLDPAACLEPTRFMNSLHPAIVDCAKRVAPDGLPTKEKAQRIFNFVRDEITYEFRAKLDPNEYVASYILSVGRGFCCQKATLQCALGRVVGIPTGVLMGTIRDRTLHPQIVAAMRTDLLRYHGLAAFYLNGQWLRADATLSPELVARKGYRLVEFNGEQEALLPATTLAGAPHVEYVEWFGAYADLPIDDMIEDFLKFWDTADIEALKRLRL